MVSTHGVDLAALNLRDALALLSHTSAAPAGDSAANPTDYLQQVIDSLCELSQTDPLTGVTNRRALTALVERAIDAVARTGTPTLLLLVDIDHFKSVNDTYGHLAGDVALRSVARCLSSIVRPQDTVARFGGEEFAILMPECELGHGTRVADRLRSALERLPIDLGGGRTLHLTTSVGGAFAPQWVRSTAELWIERADQQLYIAKASGRNTVRLAPQESSHVSAEEKSLLLSTTFPEPSAPEEIRHG